MSSPANDGTNAAALGQNLGYDPRETASDRNAKEQAYREELKRQEQARKGS